MNDGEHDFGNEDDLAVGVVVHEYQLASGDELDAEANRWTNSHAIPGRSVEAVGVEIRAAPDSKRWERGGDILPEVQAITCTDPWDCFRQGYRDFNGNLEWENTFVNDVLPCEGDYWVGYHGPPVSRYISRAQFHPGSWATAAVATGLGNPDDPYHVGANVAWWSNNISHPGDTSGWYDCWWIGLVS